MSNPNLPQLPDEATTGAPRASNVQILDSRTGPTTELADPVRVRFAPAQRDDLIQIQRWLATFANDSRAHTFRSYCNEALRFRLFLKCLYPRTMGTDAERYLLRDATESDVILYECALAHKGYAGAAPVLVTPHPAAMSSYQMERGLVTSLRRPGLDDPAVLAPRHRAAQEDVNPFANAKSQSSINLALTILKSMYEAWREPDNQKTPPYVTFNPVARPRKQQPRVQTQTNRHVPQEVVTVMWHFNESCLAAAQRDLELGSQTTGQDGAGALRVRLARLERRQWIFAMLFGAWTRRQELVDLKWNQIQQSFDGQWSVTLNRKGRKEQTIPLAGWIVETMKRYRRSLGLPATPARDENSPVLTRLRGEEKLGLTAQSLYQEVKHLCTEVCDEIEAGRLLQDLAEHQKEAAMHKLRQFSPHWFRHTGATLSINSGLLSLKDASTLLGHSSVTTTDAIYHHHDEKSMRRGIEAMGGMVQRAAG